MKKLILIAIALVNLQAFAQPGDRQERREQIQKIKDMSVEDMAELGTKKMTLDLNLSEDQQSKVQAVLLEEAKFRKQKMEEREARRDEMEKVRPSKEEHIQMEKEKLDRQIAMKENMKSILDDEQFAEWEQNMEERRSNKEKRRQKRAKGKN
ncbi:MAG: hypothetical protein AAF688_05500 [Bacteroidota bacterium]